MNDVNPYRAALVAIAVLGGVLGGGLLMAAYQVGADGGTSADQAALGETGAFVLQLGAFAFLGWLVVQAVGWREKS